MIERQFSGELPLPGKTNLDWYLFHKVVDDFRGQPMLEVGVGRGGSAYTMAYSTPILDVIDSWDQTWKKEDVEKILPANFIDSKSSQAEIDKDYSCIHLDANKSFKGTLDDLTKYSKHCSGVICVDDYLQSMWPEVTRAVDFFIDTSFWKRILIGNHQVFLSRKRTPAVRKIAIDFPVAIVNEEIFLTYGKLPSDKLFQKFMSVNNIRLYTWHRKAYT